MTMGARGEAGEGGAATNVALSIAFILMITGFIFVVVLYARGADGSDWLPVASFFAVPLGMVGALLWQLRHDDAAVFEAVGVMGVLTVFLLIAWAVMALGGRELEDRWLEAICWGGGIAVSVLVVHSAKISKKMIEGRAERHDVEGPARFFMRHPFYGLVYLALTFFVTLLTFSLALAANDWLLRGMGSKGIAGALYQSKEEEDSTQTQEPPTAADAVRIRPPVIEFPVGGDSFNFDQNLLRNAIDIDEYCTILLSDNVEERNSCALLEVVEEVDRTLKAGRGARIVLVGHADNRTLQGRRYSSDYELSEARAHQARLRLLQVMEASFGGLSEVDVEWLILPLSNEPIFLEDHGLSEQASRDVPFVEVGVIGLDSQEAANPGPPAERAPRGLLDYIYFTAYTLGTTGYGDFVPVSIFARTVVTWANLLEIFFVAMFLNIVLVRLTDSGVGKRTQSDEIKRDSSRGSPGAKENSEGGR